MKVWELYELQPVDDDDILLEKLSNLLAVGTRSALMGLLGRKESMLDRNIVKKYTTILTSEVAEYKTYKTVLNKPVIQKIFPYLETKAKDKLGFHVGEEIKPDLKNKKMILWFASINFIFEKISNKIKDWAAELLQTALSILMVGFDIIIKILFNIKDLGDFVAETKKVMVETNRVFKEIGALS